MFISPPGILSFPHLFTPRAVEENQEPSFSCDILFADPEDFKKPHVGKKASMPSILQCIQNVKIDQWGKDKTKWPKFAKPNIKKGNEKQYDDGTVLQGYEDVLYMTLRTGQKYPPRLFNINGSPARPEDLYGGAICRVQVLCRPYSTPLGKGVSLRLVAVMKVAKGEPFGIGGDMFDFEGDEDELQLDIDGNESADEEFDAITF
jgi:hypothetical protein